jgi:quercetin dioxygenase-like cupin family protein
MKKIKKIKFNQNMIIDKTGHQTGKIKLKRISEELSTKQLKAYFIKFEKGARSKIHLHDSDQIIIGTEGKGNLVIYSKINNDAKNTRLVIESSSELEEGEAVLIPAGKLHWHGASKDQSSSQISFMYNGNTYWF